MAMVANSCASVSPGRDLARVEDLAHAPLPVNSVSRPVDPAPAEEIRDLLATPLTVDSAVRIALLENRELRDANEMSDFNVLTFNAKAFPATEPLLVGKGDRVRIRLGNLSIMSHHPIHLHGLHFQVTGTDGGEVPESARFPETTTIVPVGAVRVIEFVPAEPGDWAMHCHMPHHMMNQMGHARPLFVGADTRALDRRMARVLPGYMTMGATGMGGMGEMGMPVPENSIPMRGAPGPFSYMDLGGMFTIVKVREHPRPADRDRWYAHPKDTVAARADPERMRRDGVRPDVDHEA